MPVGQETPAQGSATQLPSTQAWPPLQPVRAQPPATHRPSEQADPDPQLTPEQGSTHSPSLHTSGPAQVAPGGLAPAQPMGWHWLLPSQSNPTGQRAFSLLQFEGRQTPEVQTLPLPHRSPSSVAPLQSSSFPLHASGAGSTWPAHAPQKPPEHVCVPDLHSPTSAVPVRPP